MILNIVTFAASGLALLLTANATLSALQHEPRSSTMIRANAALLSWVGVLILFSWRLR